MLSVQIIDFVIALFCKPQPPSPCLCFCLGSPIPFELWGISCLPFLLFFPTICPVIQMEEDYPSKNRDNKLPRAGARQSGALGKPAYQRPPLPSPTPLTPSLYALTVAYY